MSLNRCTYETTGVTYQDQSYAHCYDCFKLGNQGACLPCLQLCHNGHRIGPMLQGPFFCDCRDSGVCKIRTSLTKEPMDLDDNVPIPVHSNIDNSASNTLSEKLFSVLEEDKIYSPMSIAYAMGLVHLGALGNTEKELTALFGKKQTIEEFRNIHASFNNEIIKMANAFIVNRVRRINELYIELLKNIAWISAENFANSQDVANKCNNFISQNTQGLIKDVISSDSIDMDTVAILINTIYFKANWLKKFKVEATTHNVPFNNGQTMVSMMSQTHKFPYYDNEFLQLIEMPYVGSEFCMGIILPRPNVPFHHFNLNEIKKYIFELSTYDKVDTFIPKFTHRKNVSLIPFLKKLGVNDLFDSRRSNLDNISLNTHVSEIIHEAVVIVDEAGTEAAAATVITMRCESMQMPRPHKTFRADHSFVYYIRHMKSNTFLFVGHFHGK
jgi:serine protease inhibitor